MVDPTVVIGGGLAGGAAALHLARAGLPVTVLERENGPHEKVCGEFLSIEACSDLADLGLAPARLGGVPIDTVRVHKGRHTIEARLPFVAHGLSRATLDHALLEAASRAGAHVERGVRVSGVENATVHTSSGDRRASRILLATGKHDLRALPRAQPATREGYVGFKMHWRLSPAALRALGSAIELVLFGKGYAGFQRVGAQDANLCLVVKRSHFAEVGGTWEALLRELMREPALERRLADAEALFARPLAIANLPYGHIHAPGSTDDPIWRLGDQAAMTASLSGDGMSVALRSACLAADCVIQGATPAKFQALLSRQTGGQVRRAMMLQRLSERPILLQAGVLAARAWPGLLTKGAVATRLPAYRAPTR